MQKVEKNLYTGIIILNYNNFEDTINCVKSVEKYNTAKVKFVIVDNGSTRSNVVDSLHDYFTSEYTKEYKQFSEIPTKPQELPYCSFVVNPANLGYARGNNLGLQLAMCDKEISHVMILNNDVLFVEDIIPSLLEKLSALHDCAIISPMLLKKDMKGFDDTCARMNPTALDLILECFMIAVGNNGYRDKIKRKYWCFIEEPSLREEELLKIDMPSGSCMLINKQIFESIGFFDPNTFLYFEENILAAKILSIGMANYLVPKLRCIHLGASSTKASPSVFIQKCGLRSRVYYLTHYCNLNMMEYLLLYVAKTMMEIKLFILQETRK